MTRIFLVFCAGLAARVEVSAQTPPPEADRCLARIVDTGVATMEPVNNPFYLRGDFDGDKKPDLAFVVRGRQSGKLRILICRSTGSVALLGSEAEKERPFSTMPSDVFVTDIWYAATKRQVREATAYNCGGPVRPRSMIGEVILLVGDGGFAMIYWNGKSFVFSGARSCDA